MKKIKPTDLKEMSVSSMIEYIDSTIMQDIPETMGEYDIQKMEILLSRIPNSYAYIMTLLSYSRTFVREAKRDGNKERYEDMMDKRDALESISAALKLQYQGISRKITLYEQKYDALNMWEYRKGDSDDKINTNKSNWDNIR